jgi:hypothetical protein
VGGSGGPRGASLAVAAGVVEQFALPLGGELLGHVRVVHHRGLLDGVITFHGRAKVPCAASGARP